MSMFEEDIIQRFKTSILDSIGKENYVFIPFSERRPLPKEFIDKLWSSVDWESVLEKIKPEMEKRICNAIISNMETEIKTDIKKVLSVENFREKLRTQIYPKIMQLLD